jgi:hypothetical protein
MVTSPRGEAEAWSFSASAKSGANAASLARASDLP